MAMKWFLAMTLITFQATFAEGNFAGIAADLGAHVSGGQCAYSIKELAHLDSDRMENQLHEFLNEDQYQEDWACVMLERHLSRDSLKGCFPSTEDVFHQRPSGIVKVEGTVKYMGMFRQPYRYDISTDTDGKVLIHVKIHFYGELGEDEKALKETDEKLSFASLHWSKQSPDGNFRFRFERVKNVEESHFSVKLVSKHNGTKYNSIWAADDYKYTTAHEVGHMLGLDDEYGIVRSILVKTKNEVHTRQCDLRSLMCTNYQSNWSFISPYHFYVILRRALCLP
jgi:hypothetical protein